MTRSAIKTWIVKVPLIIISEQLGISEASLRRILAFAKAHPLNPISPGSLGVGSIAKSSRTPKKEKKKLVNKRPTITAKKIKKTILALANVTFTKFRNFVKKAEVVLKEDGSNAPSPP